MEFKVWQNGWVFIYELNGCGFESRCCHTINMKKYLDPRRGSSFGPLSFFFFSAFSQKTYCCHEQKQIILLKNLVGLAFFLFMKYYFVNFVQEVWRVLRCNSVLKGHIHKELFDSNCLPERHFVFCSVFHELLILKHLEKISYI